MLTLDLIPRCVHRFNARLVLSNSQWDKVRKSIYQKNNFKCQVCGATEHLECHERFQLDETTCVYKLIELQCLCKSCHMCKHIVRLAKLDDEMKTFWECILRMEEINKAEMGDILEYILNEIQICKCLDYNWQEICHRFRLDLSLIGDDCQDYYYYKYYERIKRYEFIESKLERVLCEQLRIWKYKGAEEQEKKIYIERNLKFQPPADERVKINKKKKRRRYYKDRTQSDVGLPLGVINVKQYQAIKLANKPERSI